MIFHDAKIVSNRHKDVAFKLGDFSNKYSSVIRELSAKAVKISESVSGIFYEAFEASEMIKIYRGKGFFTKRFDQGERVKEENTVCLEHKKNMLKALTVLGIMTLQITTILIACFLLDISQNAGMIVGIINVLIGSIFYPFIDIQDVIIGKNEYYNAAGRINRFIENHSMEPLGDASQELGEIKRIVFDNVSFRYDQNRGMAYENFEFGKNEIVGIYGESGTGKTTIANLILNRLKPEKGKIKVTDINGQVHDLNGSLKVSYLSSHNNLFRASILDNVRMGNEAVSLEEVTDALKKLNLFDKISENSLGFNAVIGMDIDFSEGEKRRLCLIRAMLQAEDFVILDEPFASIDKENIKSVLEFLSQKKDNRGIIIISHDKDLDEIADRTYIIKGRKAL